MFSSSRKVRMILVNMLGQFSGILCALLAYGLAYIDGRGGLVRTGHLALYLSSSDYLLLQSGWQWAFVIGMEVFSLCYHSYSPHEQRESWVSSFARRSICSFPTTPTLLHLSVNS